MSFHGIVLTLLSILGIFMLLGMVALIYDIVKFYDEEEL